MTEHLVCSAKGCRQEAAWALRWNNPKLHTADRRKTWLACPDHRLHLENFLGARSFLRETIPVADLPPESGVGGSDPRVSPDEPK
ncbi:hypothetical protein [Occultella aeris]